MAQLIKVDGTEQELNPANGSSFTLEEMQAAVGGYIEVVRLSDGRLLVINEEGKVKNLPFNLPATLLWNPPPHSDYIVGDAILTNEREMGD